jgi:hypothetical protein
MSSSSSPSAARRVTKQGPAQLRSNEVLGGEHVRVVRRPCRPRTHQSCRPTPAHQSRGCRPTLRAPLHMWRARGGRGELGPRRCLSPHTACAGDAKTAHALPVPHFRPAAASPSSSSAGYRAGRTAVSTPLCSPYTSHSQPWSAPLHSSLRLSRPTVLLGLLILVICAEGGIRQGMEQSWERTLSNVRLGAGMQAGLATWHQSSLDGHTHRRPPPGPSQARVRAWLRAWAARLLPCQPPGSQAWPLAAAICSITGTRPSAKLTACGAPNAATRHRKGSQSQAPYNAVTTPPPPLPIPPHRDRHSQRRLVLIVVLWGHQERVQGV